MQVRDILDSTEEFPTIVTDATASRAAQLMRANDVRAVAVVEGERLVGIVTDWDIVDALAQKGSELADLPVSAIMTKENLVTVDIDATVVEATRRLAERQVHHLPVLEGGEYRGVICLGLEWAEGGMLAPPVRATLTGRHP